MKTLILKVYIIIISLYSIPLSAQNSFDTLSDAIDNLGPIYTDRPDQTETSPLTPKGWFQIESGMQREFDNKKDYRAINTIYNTSLIKYGLSKHFELRLITESGQEIIRFSDTAFKKQVSSGVYPIKIGSKIKICDAKGWIPAVSLISHLALPLLGSEDFKSKYTIPQFRFTFVNNLTDCIVLSYNIGSEWEDGSSNATYIYTASLAFSFLDRMGLFIESYGFLRERTIPDHRMDAGLTTLLTDNLQLDIPSGIGLSPISPTYFISCGASWRFNAFDKTRTFQGKKK
jgi:hypothetical protein